MTTKMRVRNVDSRAWRAATWASPFTIQLLLGVVISISWLVGTCAWSPHGFGQYAIGTGAALLLSALISVALFTRRSFRAQGVAISVVGSFVVAITDATFYGLWIIGW